MVAIPLIVKTVIDGPLADGDRAGVVRWAAVAAGLALVEMFLAFSRRYLLALVSTDLETELRDDLYAHLQRLDVGFHDRWQSGQLLSRAMTDLVDHPALRRLRRGLLRPHHRAGGRDLRGPARASRAAGAAHVRRRHPRRVAVPPLRAAVPRDRPPHPGPDRRPHDHDRGGRQGHPRPQGVRPWPGGVRRLRAPGHRDPRHPDRAHHAAHPVRLGARRHPEPHAHGGAARRRARGRARAASPSAAWSRSCPTC